MEIPREHQQAGHSKGQDSVNSQAQKPKGPLVKADATPESESRDKKTSAQRAVWYHAKEIDAKGNVVNSKDHVLTLSEHVLENKKENICSPSCVETNPDRIKEGETRDTQQVITGDPYSVERHWSVDGKPAQVLDQQNNLHDYEILKLSNEADSPFQLEYHDNPH